MFKEHPSFKSPKNWDQKCWRYLDFIKFIDLIDSSQLYFTRIDKLEDQFEGTFTKKTYKKKNNAGLNYPNFYKQLRADTLVNCWHMNDYESAAMWKLYLKSDEGIAIQSTYKRIIKGLKPEKRFNTYVGVVKYLDYETDEFNFGNAFNASLCKRKSFEHEREIRMMVDLSIENPKFESSKLQVDHGYKININLTDLIECVYISPTAPQWIIKLIKAILTKYNLNLPVQQSQLIGNALI